MASLTAFFVSLTERILLLLGWERLRLKDSDSVYTSNKAHIELVGTLRKRKGRSKASGNDMFAAKPDLAPAPLVNQNARGPASANAWSSATVDAFDTAVTGTV